MQRAERTADQPPRTEPRQTVPEDAESTGRVVQHAATCRPGSSGAPPAGQPVVQADPFSAKLVGGASLVCQLPMNPNMTLPPAGIVRL